MCLIDAFTKVGVVINPLLQTEGLGNFNMEVVFGCTILITDLFQNLKGSLVIHSQIIQISQVLCLPILMPSF